MRKYYFVASLLPPLRIGNPSDISFSEFMFACEVNLHKDDLRKVQVLRRYYDLQNLRLLIAKPQVDEELEKELDYRGNMDENTLEEALVAEAGFPQYVYDFLDKYEDQKDRLAHFPALISEYFSREAADAGGGFLQRYLTFEREWRLVLAGFRAKKMGRDISAELQFENPDDDLIRQMLAQRDAETFEPPDRFRDLKEIFVEFGDDPLALHQALCEYRFAKIEEMLGTDMFSIDRILGYMAQLITVLKWLELDKKKGLQIVKAAVKDVS
ncbi:MAG: DUF2764 family protein [Chlamydiales bacterium]|nr:DUF2764 family protein [Chlamydiales bacterium]